MMNPEMFDIVELLINIPEHNLFTSAQGAIVECHNDHDFEVEFSDQNGSTQALCTLSRPAFIVVWKSSTQKWLSPAEKITAILNQLHEDQQEEILNYARFVYQKA
jgi:ABC-type phosphate transport system substrate-binding protein